MPDQCRNPADRQPNPDSGKNHPQTPTVPIKEEDVCCIRVKRGGEINEEESHLVHIATKMLARESMTEFVDPSESKQEKPEHPNVVGSLVLETVQALGVGHDARPVARHEIDANDKQN